MILAGDIGGTTTLLALFEIQGNVPVSIIEKKYASHQLQSLEKLVEMFLKESAPQLEDGKVEAACFSIAGPVYDAMIHLSNLDLTLNLKEIRQSLRGIPRIEFCNDLQALGYGLLTAPAQDIFCLYPGASTLDEHENSLAQQNRLHKAVIAPGTGLGEALIIESNYVLPTEGGHGDFAPQSEEEVHLWRFLQQEFGHVSYERILSGPGLVNIYRFLTQNTTPVNLTEFPPSPQAISQQALTGSCPICQHALALFVRVLGAEAGNLALKSLALGGVYLGGGIPPRILSKLQEKTFLQSFHSKGRFTDLMKKIPVYVILNDRTTLYGAALWAAKSM